LTGGLGSGPSGTLKWLTDIESPMLLYHVLAGEYKPKC
jgi:hypothetical protein